MKTTWWRVIAMPVLWLGVFSLLWALGAWLLFATMAGIRDEMLLDAVVRVALVVALVTGTALSRRSRTGYQILAATGLACAVLYGGAFTVGSITGIVTLVAAAATLVAALVRLRTSTAPEGAPEGGAGETAGSLVRSPVEAAAAWSRRSAAVRDPLVAVSANAPGATMAPPQ